MFAVFAGAAIPDVLSAGRPPPLFGLQGAAAPAVAHRLPCIFLLQLLLVLSVREMV